MFNCKSIAEARKIRDRIIEDYRDVAEAAVSCLDDGFESAMTVMTLPRYMRKYFRTSNHIERLNKELKRRSKVIGVFPNEDSLMRLIGSVLVERNEDITARKCIFTNNTYRELMATELPAKLVDIANEQRLLLAA